MGQHSGLRVQAKALGQRETARRPAKGVTEGLATGLEKHRDQTTGTGAAGFCPKSRRSAGVRSPGLAPPDFPCEGPRSCVWKEAVQRGCSLDRKAREPLSGNCRRPGERRRWPGPGREPGATSSAHGLTVTVWPLWSWPHAGLSVRDTGDGCSLQPLADTCSQAQPT